MAAAGSGDAVDALFGGVCDVTEVVASEVGEFRVPLVKVPRLSRFDYGTEPLIEVLRVGH